MSELTMMRDLPEVGGGMRLVTTEEFARMPAGTVFAPFEPYVLKDRLEIKVDGGALVTNGRGERFWAYNGTMPLEPWNMEDLNDIGDRADAEYEVCDGDQNDLIDEKMILVLERQDVERMIGVLKWALEGCK